MQGFILFKPKSVFQSKTGCFWGLKYINWHKSFTDANVGCCCAYTQLSLWAFHADLSVCFWPAMFWISKWAGKWWERQVTASVLFGGSSLWLSVFLKSIWTNSIPICIRRRTNPRSQITEMLWKFDVFVPLAF